MDLINLKFFKKYLNKITKTKLIGFSSGLQGLSNMAQTQSTWANNNHSSSSLLKPMAYFNPLIMMNLLASSHQQQHQQGSSVLQGNGINGSNMSGQSNHHFAFSNLSPPSSSSST